MEGFNTQLSRKMLMIFLACLQLIRSSDSHLLEVHKFHERRFIRLRLLSNCLKNISEQDFFLKEMKLIVHDSNSGKSSSDTLKKLLFLPNISFDVVDDPQDFYTRLCKYSPKSSDCGKRTELVYVQFPHSEAINPENFSVFILKGDPNDCKYKDVSLCSYIQEEGKFSNINDMLTKLYGTLREVDNVQCPQPHCEENNVKMMQQNPSIPNVTRTSGASSSNSEASTKETEKKNNVTTKEEYSVNSVDNSNSKRQVSVNLSISDTKNQFGTGLTILSDPSILLFKIYNKSITYELSLFNVLFRLLKDDFFYSLIGKEEKLAVIMLKLKEEAEKGQKDQDSVNKLTNELVEVLEKKYNFTICSVYEFITNFLTYIVESDLDKDNKYFGMELEDEAAEIFAEKATNNRVLPLFRNDDNMFSGGEFKWGFTKKPKLVFFRYQSKGDFEFYSNKHLKIQLEDGTDESETIYNLKGVIFSDENFEYNSFFIQNDVLYDQRTGGKQSIAKAKFCDIKLLIYELRE